MSTMITVEMMKDTIVARNLDNMIKSPTIVEKCTALCNRYNFGLDVFLGQLEAFVMNSNTTSVTLENIGEFERTLHQESQQVKKKLIFGLSSYS
jgi:hypothetical protein